MIGVQDQFFGYGNYISIFIIDSKLIIYAANGSSTFEQFGNPYGLSTYKSASHAILYHPNLGYPVRYMYIFWVFVPTLTSRATSILWAY